MLRGEVRCGWRWPAEVTPEVVRQVGTSFTVWTLRGSTVAPPDLVPRNVVSRAVMPRLKSRNARASADELLAPDLAVFRYAHPPTVKAERVHPLRERLDAVREPVAVWDQVAVRGTRWRRPAIVDRDVAVPRLAHPAGDHRLGGLKHVGF